jgi:[ribosomal protein S5]-alanine N-acetyltransferase
VDIASPAVADLEIIGPVLTLRYPKPEDAPALFALGSDPEVTRFFSWGPYRAQAEAEAYIAGLPEKRDAGALLDFAIVRGGEPLGITGLSEPAPRDRRATVGSWIGRPAWGTGVNAEAKALILGLAFGPLGLERVTAYAGAGNDRSQAALAKIGFVREGLLRRFHRHGDRVHDVAVFSLLREEWAASPLANEAVQIRGDVPAGFAAA